MTTLEDSREADKRSTSNAEPIVSSNVSFGNFV